MGNLFTSSIGRKLIMSITGLFLFLFLVFHMSMNIVAIFSAESYDKIAEFLGANWYALIGTAILAAGVVIHFVYALILTLQNRAARGKQRYAIESQPEEVDWASRNMFVLGLIIILGLLLHLYNFWYNMQLAEILRTQLGPHEPTEGAAYIKDLFSQPVYVAIYLVWLGALWFHLTHGLWSSIQTIGWNNRIWLKRVKCIANIFATVIFLGFASVVVVFFVRSLM